MYTGVTRGDSLYTMVSAVSDEGPREGTAGDFNLVQHM